MVTYTLVLPANNTYAVRHATLIRVTNPGADEITATLEIRESRCGDGKPTISRFCVRGDRLPNGDLRFRLTKPGGTLTYFCCIPADPYGYPTCECIGYETRGWCKHVAALREAVAKKCF